MSDTLGDLIKNLSALKDREEARTFLIEKLKGNPSAWSNILWVTGYLGNEERNRILNLFE